MKSTHVTIYGIELAVDYDYVEDTAILVHARVTELAPGVVGRFAVGPDLSEFLHESQVSAIEQAIYLQEQEYPEHVRDRGRDAIEEMRRSEE